MTTTTKNLKIILSIIIRCGSDPGHTMCPPTATCRKSNWARIGTIYCYETKKKPLNFTICRNTQLEGAISGPDRAPILQAQVWARSGRAFHYWSGARQITLSGPHFSRSGPDRRPTKISARGRVVLLKISKTRFRGDILIWILLDFI